MTNRRTRRTTTAAMLLLALLLGGLAWATLPVQSPVAMAAYGVSGVVYRDFNGDGVRDPFEPGVGNVSVVAYNAAGEAVATAPTSDLAGTLGEYTLNIPNDDPVRVEFVTLPDDTQSGASGPGSGTSVQFVTGAATDVNFAVSAPGDYCQNNPELVTSCYVYGDQTSGDAAFISFPYESGTTSQTSAAGVDSPTSHALAILDNQIGATWGAGYQRQTRSIFLGAFTKRHVGYGPGGIGAIYRIDRASGDVETFLDLNALFPGSAGTSSRVPAADGTIDYFNDADSWDDIGKTAFGDLEVTRDGSALYAVALGDRQLYRVPLAGLPPVAPGAEQITPISLPTPADCPSPDDLRPGALGTLGDTLFVGLTCSAESSGLASDLRAYVYAFDGLNFTQVVNLPLDYGRGCVSRSLSTGECADAAWNAWEPTVTERPAPFGQLVYPQPWLTDIEFDEQGFMILGISDRYGHQSGNNIPEPAVGPANGVAAGDILRLAPAGATWTPESDGSVGGVTTGGAGNGEGPGGGEFYFHDRFRVPESESINHDEITLGGLVLVKGRGEVAVSAFDPPPVGGGVRTGGVIWLSNFIDDATYAPGERTRSYQIFATDVTGTFGKAAGIGDIEALCEAAPIEIGNRLWRDSNGNGIQDPGEPPLAGVTVRLYDSQNNLVGSVVSDLNGNYYFSNAPGSSTTSIAYNLGGFGPDGIANTADDLPGLKPSENGITNTYTVRLDNPADFAAGGPLAGLTLSPDNSTPPGGSDRNDSDAELLANPPGSPAGAWPVIPVTTGPSGENNHALDVGFSEPVSVGNRIWRDDNNNGVQDAGEPGIPGVSVELFRDEDCDSMLASNEQTRVALDVTDADGLYLFDSFTDLAGNPLTRLTPGCYLVGVPPGNFEPGEPLAGFVSSGTSLDATGVVELAPPSPDSDPSDVDDNCARVAPGSPFYPGGALTPGVTLAVGDEPTGENPSNDTTTPDNSGNLTVDCGFYALSLGNLVWLDADNSGRLESGETGLNNVTLRLYADANADCAPDGAPLAEQLSSNGGRYLFTGLVSGTYLVELVPPPGLSGSTGTPGSPTGPYEPGIPESNNPADDNQDHGTNGPTIRACAVTLTPGAEPTGEPDQELPTGVTNPAPDANSQLTVDFGLFGEVLAETLSLGNEIWIDADNNGRRDATESPVPDGVVVQLFADLTGDGDFDDAGEDVPLRSTTTTGGLYLFDGLAPGTYAVGLAPASFEAGGPLAGFTSSTGTPGSATGPYEPAPAVDSTPTDGDDNCSVVGTLGAGGTIRSGPVTLAVGDEPTGENPDNDPTTPDANENLTVDCGLFQPARLGDFVWRDTNGNGQQDPGEPGVNDVTATLLQNTPSGPVVIATTTTAPNGGQDGFYQFTNLPPGEYVVVFSNLPASTGFTSPNQGDDATDSDANQITGRSAPVTLSPGDSVQTVDAGLVEVTTPQTGRLDGIVWNDTNGNGQRDPGEPPVPGVIVTLFPGTGSPIPIITTTTTQDGSYRFENLPPGDYLVGFEPPRGFGFTSPNQGNDATDSDADPSTGRTPPVTVTAGQPTTPLDAGLVFTTVALGNCVWEDLDNDGRQESGEPPIAGVTIKLYGADGATEINVGPDGVLGTADDAPGGMRTAPNGCYLFRGLQPGDYVVEVTPPTGFRSSTGAPSLTDGPFEGPATPDPDDDVDFDDNGTTVGAVVRAKPVTLTVGGEPTNDAPATPNPDPLTPNNSSNLTVDFGFFRVGSIGNLVWNDVNNNGRVDPGENGIDGVPVNLYFDRNGNGQPDAGELLRSTTTAGGGRYLFGDLPPGSFIVELAPASFAPGGPLVGFSSSTGVAGSLTNPGGPFEPAPSPDNDVDNDDNGTLDANRVLSRPLTLTPGSEPTNDGDSDPTSNLTLDFGMFRPASLGLLVWDDQNGDGVRQPGEPGIGGVRITLFGADGTTVLAQTISGPDGTFSFVNLPPGSYILSFGNLPQGYSFTSQDQGPNDQADSDVNPATGRTQPVTLVPGQNDLTIGAGLRPTTTAIVLSSFTASWAGGNVVVRWTTVQELNTFGFHLYRSSSGKRADAVRITPQLILAQGRGQGGASYAFVDTDSVPGESYSYWLEETEVAGQTLEYGPALSTQARATDLSVLFLPLARR